jgi:hypothetical protein
MGVKVGWCPEPPKMPPLANVPSTGVKMIHRPRSS